MMTSLIARTVLDCGHLKAAKWGAKFKLFDYYSAWPTSISVFMTFVLPHEMVQSAIQWDRCEYSFQCMYCDAKFCLLSLASHDKHDTGVILSIFISRSAHSFLPNLAALAISLYLKAWSLHSLQRRIKLLNVLGFCLKINFNSVLLSSNANQKQWDKIHRRNNNQAETLSKI